MDAPLKSKIDSRLAIIIIFALCAAGLALFYSFFTNHIWEDFFITFRHSQNLIQGKGLVYTPGERVHGFTSPLGVLLPALTYLMTGAKSYLEAIWLFRIFSIAFYAGAGVVLLLILYRKNITSELAYLFLAVFYLFDAKSLDFSINGMETAFMLFFLAWFIFLMSKDDFSNWKACGIAWAEMMYTRPDGIVYITTFCFSLFIFEEERKKLVLFLAKAGFLCALLYLPWFIGTWLYYGSFLPHTVIAKSYLHSQINWFNVDQFAFGPVYMNYSKQPAWLYAFGLILGAAASFYWFLPVKDKLGRSLSLTVFLMHFYFLSIRTAPWYFPPFTMMSSFVIIYGAFTLSARSIEKTTIKIAVALPLLLFSVGMMYLSITTALQMKVQQKEVENGNRMQIGLWLKDQVKQNERVYTESLGYIGYFSQAKMLDFPGLVSNEVASAVRKNKTLNYYSLPAVLKPEWIVARPFEVKGLYTTEYFRKNYKLAKIFSVYENLADYNYIPWPGYALYDCDFLIFKKQ